MNAILGAVQRNAAFGVSRWSLGQRPGLVPEMPAMAPPSVVPQAPASYPISPALSPAEQVQPYQMASRAFKAYKARSDAPPATVEKFYKDYFACVDMMGEHPREADACFFALRDAILQATRDLGPAPASSSGMYGLGQAATGLTLQQCQQNLASLDVQIAALQQQIDMMKAVGNQPMASALGSQMAVLQDARSQVQAKCASLAQAPAGPSAGPSAGKQAALFLGAAAAVLGLGYLFLKVL